MSAKRKAIATASVRSRPTPDSALLEGLEPLFIPSPEVTSWVTETFVNPDGPLANSDHAHLIGASIGVSWSNVLVSSKQRRIVGQTEVIMPRGNPWAREREKFWITQWFGEIPDFLITFDAVYAAECTDVEWCALVEHELFHCGQQLDRYGYPKFHRDGTPVYAIRGHDVEEFVGVVARYGAGNAAGGTAALVAAAQERPSIGRAQIDWACGTCVGSRA